MLSAALTGSAFAEGNAVFTWCHWKGETVLPPHPARGVGHQQHPLAPTRH